MENTTFRNALFEKTVFVLKLRNFVRNWVFSARFMTKRGKQVWWADGIASFQIRQLWRKPIRRERLLRKSEEWVWNVSAASGIIHTRHYRGVECVHRLLEYGVCAGLGNILIRRSRGAETIRNHHTCFQLHSSRPSRSIFTRGVKNNSLRALSPSSNLVPALL